jgi:Beta-L-arabinofuranosidase, GH127
MITSNLILSASALIAFWVVVSERVAAQQIETHETAAVMFPPIDRRSDLYVSNREPLAATPLIRLPIASIQPTGWMRKQLELQAAGFHGHLTEISPFLRKEGNAWLNPEGKGDHGWEEPPYWLKGYLNLAYLLRDDAMIKESHEWIEGALASQKQDGWFGPDVERRGVATDLVGRDDLWPNMIMLFCLQDYYDYSGDKRVIQLIERYFNYLQGVSRRLNSATYRRIKTSQLE